MKAIIITIGDELLQGFTLNTNTNWISRNLSELHVNVLMNMTIQDTEDSIHSALDVAFEKNAEYIFITGGLGPTHDDITRESLKSYFQCELRLIDEHHQMLLDKIKRLGRDIPSNLQSQSTILSISDVIPNAVGSALGMKILHRGVRVFVMPGVPAEMKSMMTGQILMSEFTKPDHKKFLTLRTTGVGESMISDKISSLISQYKSTVKTAFLPSHTGVNIRLKNISGNPRDILELKEGIGNILGDIIYSEEDRTLVEITGELLLQRDMTLSVAESCTGGLITKLFTDYPGSSGFLLGGITAYHNLLKSKLLDIPESILNNFGAVSEETAELMAENVREITHSDISVSTTGISGPAGGSDDKPVGLVYIGISDQNGTRVKRFNFLKDRKLHREMTANTAVNMIRRKILNEYPASQHN